MLRVVNWASSIVTTPPTQGSDILNEWEDQTRAQRRDSFVTHSKVRVYFRINSSPFKLSLVQSPGHSKKYGPELASCKVAGFSEHFNRDHTTFLETSQYYDYNCAGYHCGNLWSNTPSAPSLNHYWKQLTRSPCKPEKRSGCFLNLLWITRSFLILNKE